MIWFKSLGGILGLYNLPLAVSLAFDVFVLTENNLLCHKVFCIDFLNDCIIFWALAIDCHFESLKPVLLNSEWQCSVKITKES